LPKKWERYNYPDWNDGTYKSNHEKLGNLLVLEGGKNIKIFMYFCTIKNMSL